MAATELIILSSSPPNPGPLARLNCTPPSAQQYASYYSSSPPLPLNYRFSDQQRDDFNTKRLKSGSRAEPIPMSAVTGFSSTASLVSNGLLSLDAEEKCATGKKECDKEEDKPDEKRAEKSRKKRDDTKANSTTKEAKPRGRKSKASAQLEADESTRSKAAPGEASRRDDEASVGEKARPVKLKRKPRVPKPPAEKQSIVKIGKVTKPKASKRVSEEKCERKKRDGTRKRRAASDKAQQYQEPYLMEDHRPAVVDIPLGLDEALSRRLDWTPTKNTLTGEKEEESEVHGAAVNIQGAKSFSGLLTSFEYAQVPSVKATSPKHRATSGEPLSKQRKVESAPTLPALELTKPKPAKKAKSPKKKPLTITDRATAAYKVVEENSTIEKVTGPVSEFFAPTKPTGESKTLTVDQAPKPQSTRKASKSRSRSPEKKQPKPRKKATKSAKAKAVVEIPKLLSPHTALSKFSNQDLLFGTSSQLARDESPTFIRTLQAAIKESEVSLRASNDTNTAGSSWTSRFTSAQTRSSIWGAAARDFDHGLLQKSFEAPAQESVSLSRDYLQTKDKIYETIGLQESTQHLAHSIPSLDGANDSELYHNHEDTCDLNAIKKGDGVMIDLTQGSDGLDKKTHLGVQNSPLAEASPEISQESRIGDEPRLDNTTSVPINLNRPVLQPLPSRVNILSPKLPNSPESKACLHTCSLLNSPKPSAAKQKQMATPTKRPRGRPRKDGSLPQAKDSSIKRDVGEKGASTTQRDGKRDWTTMDEIEDSEADSTPTPPRRRRNRAPPSPGTLELSPSQSQLSAADAEEPPHQPKKPAASKPNYTRLAATLFPQITQAVKSFPSTRDPHNPSWYEKILMYDPIVLEDLTDWLNAHGLRVEGKTGAPQELELPMVQKWCEMNSVCSLRKEGLRGGVRKRY